MSSSSTSTARCFTPAVPVDTSKAETRLLDDDVSLVQVVPTSRTTECFVCVLFLLSFDTLHYIYKIRVPLWDTLMIISFWVFVWILVLPGPTFPFVTQAFSLTPIKSWIGFCATERGNTPTLSPVAAIHMWGNTPRWLSRTWGHSVG